MSPCECSRNPWDVRRHILLRRAIEEWEILCWRQRVNRNNILSAKENRVFDWEMVADTKKVKRPQGWPNIDMLSLFRAGHTLMPVYISKSTRCRGIRCSDSIFFCFLSHTGQVKHFPKYVQPRLNVFSSSITDGSNGEARVNLWTLRSLVLRPLNPLTLGGGHTCSNCLWKSSQSEMGC